MSKVKEVVLHKKKKIPVEGVDYSSKETMVSLTIELEEGQDELSPEEYTRYWKTIKSQLDKGLRDQE